jgi:hypothetical protein
VTAPPPASKFCKRVHHVVPVSWQEKFAAPGTVGAFYKNVLNGKTRGPEGPGQKMAEEYANIVFDGHYRPSDRLEDALGSIETKTMPLFGRMIAASALDPRGRVDLAYFLAVQACRYPEQFSRRLDLGRLLGIAIKDCSVLPNAAAMNAHLRAADLLPGANFSDAEFERLKTAPEQALVAELDGILQTHGYEAFFNPELVISGARPIAEVLLGFKWDLLEATEPTFILSDRPMPEKLGDGFSLGLTARFGLRVRRPPGPVHEGTIAAVPASIAEVQSINSEVRARARQWICGPDPSIQAL